MTAHDNLQPDPRYPDELEVRDANFRDWWAVEGAQLAAQVDVSLDIAKELAYTMYCTAWEKSARRYRPPLKVIS